MELYSEFLRRWSSSWTKHSVLSQPAVYAEEWTSFEVSSLDLGMLLLITQEDGHLLPLSGV